MSSTDRKLDRARAWDAAHGHDVDLWRGLAHRGLCAYRVTEESGGDRFAVSRDPVLIEVGWSQVPLAYAWRRGVDPFTEQGGIYLLCRDEHEAAAKWAEQIPGLSARDLAYLTALNYSVGGGATRRLLVLAELARQHGTTYEERIVWVGEHVDLGTPKNRRAWGRQKPEQIRARIAKKHRWLNAAEKIVPFTGQAGPLPPPDGPGPFPVELIRYARVCESRSATHAEHVATRDAVIAYAKARRRAERGRKAPLLWRLGKRLGLDL